MNMDYIIRCLIMVTLTSCALGPNYQRPDIQIPEKFKESGLDFQIAAPSDEKDKGEWWKILKEPILDSLEDKLNQHNYSILVAESNYKAAFALVDKARISYLPTISSSNYITRQKQNGANNQAKISVTHGLLLNASWEADFWGGVSRQVESAKASAELDKALIANVRLSAQASLAQSYFEYKMLLKDQQYLDQTVSEYQIILGYSKNRFASGVTGDQQITQAEQQLQIAKSAYITNKISIAQMEHAIAVLIGESPAVFSPSKSCEIIYSEVSVPPSLPSTVIERRPDVAAAERQVAVASAGIGIAKAAFFPNFSLISNANYQGSGVGKLLSMPTLLWSVGPELALNLGNLAAYKATQNVAKESYNAAVANYKNTVLSAFQEVEDNLIALKLLKEQLEMLKIASSSAKRNLDITARQYSAGIIDQSQLSLAKIAYYSSEKNLSDAEALLMTTTIALIKALGGGWE